LEAVLTSCAGAHPALIRFGSQLSKPQQLVSHLNLLLLQNKRHLIRPVKKTIAISAPS
uniref:Non-structural protein NS-S n=1 Tax=Haemonchus placei TaxID=6290 RepID=A0A0N4WS71_HAEPC